MEYLARNDSKIVLAKSICEVVLPPRSAVVLFERARGGGEGGAGHVSMTKWARFCISNHQEMPGSSDQGRALLGLCIPRSLPRWDDPDPLGVLSPATILKTPASTQKVKMASLATLGGSKSKPTRTRRRF